jgi:exopolyphosphatase/guanosine-5'-triphosphate,3'-diphosphate pyrophosphatase
MRLAAVDIGTNSVHMIVVQVRPDLSFEVVDREKEMVRLGSGGLGGRGLTDTAMSAALQTLAKFRRLADSCQVDEIVAGATSAVREAGNGGDFLTAVERQTGIRPRVISGTEEARLIHQAAVYGVDFGAGSGVVIDIGGGSAEITLGPASGARLARSFKLGVIRLTEQFVGSDPLSARDERRLVRHVNREIAAYADRLRSAGFDRVVGTSGTILSLGTVALTERGKRVTTLRSQRVSARQLHRLRKQIVRLDLDGRLAIPGLDPRRADLVVAGSVLLDTILRRIGAEELVLCDLSLREGLILDYINQNRTRIAQVDRYPDPRRRSVVELGERCGAWTPHAEQVARLALALFDQMRPAHGLGDREREWLEYGALLHDVGVHISYNAHHKHSYYLIKHGDLRGFEPDEVEVIAQIARYHRRARPRKSHTAFAALPSAKRRAVKRLAGFVRLAEGLDRSHAQVIERVQVQPRADDYLVKLLTRGDAELEVWAAHRHVAPIERILGKVIRFEVTEAANVEHPEQPASVPGEAVRRRGDRRMRQDHAARAAGQVAGRRRASRGRHRVELVGARQGRDQHGQEEEHADADDVQPAARD